MSWKGLPQMHVSIGTPLAHSLSYQENSNGCVFFPFAPRKSSERSTLKSSDHVAHNNIALNIGGAECSRLGMSVLGVVRAFLSAEQWPDNGRTIEHRLRGRHPTDRVEGLGVSASVQRCASDGQ